MQVPKRVWPGKPTHRARYNSCDRDVHNNLLVFFFVLVELLAVFVMMPLQTNARTQTLSKNDALIVQIE